MEWHFKPSIRFYYPSMNCDTRSSRFIAMKNLSDVQKPTNRNCVYYS
jgi:hypothetical protein